jgi:hypothetical protein
MPSLKVVFNALREGVLDEFDDLRANLADYYLSALKATQAAWRMHRAQQHQVLKCFLDFSLDDKYLWFAWYFPQLERRLSLCCVTCQLTSFLTCSIHSNCLPMVPLMM